MRLSGRDNGAKVVGLALKCHKVVQGKIYGKTLVMPDGFQARKMIIQFPRDGGDGDAGGG